MVNMGNVWDRTSEFLSENMAALLPIALVALLVPHSIAALIGSAGTAINAACARMRDLAGVRADRAVGTARGDCAGARSRRRASARGGIGDRQLRSRSRGDAAVVRRDRAHCRADAARAGRKRHGSGAAERRRDGEVSLSGGAKTFVLIYALVLVGVCVLVSIRLVMLYPVIVAEGGVIAALRRAFALSRGHRVEADRRVAAVRRRLSASGGWR